MVWFLISPLSSRETAQNRLQQHFIKLIISQATRRWRKDMSKISYFYFSFQQNWKKGFSSTLSLYLLKFHLNMAFFVVFFFWWKHQKQRMSLTANTLYHCNINQGTIAAERQFLWCMIIFFACKSTENVPRENEYYAIFEPGNISMQSRRDSHYTLLQ